MQMGIIGCGDFLRWMAPGIKTSREVAVKWLFDPVRERAERYAAELGGQPAESAEAVFADPEVEIACLFVPPWLRADLWEQAARADKHVLATKPLAPAAAECEHIAALAKDAEARGHISHTGKAHPPLPSGKGELEIRRQNASQCDAFCLLTSNQYAL